MYVVLQAQKHMLVLPYPECHYVALIDMSERAQVFSEAYALICVIAVRAQGGATCEGKHCGQDTEV